MSTLFVNACVRENSRTLTLAERLLKKLSDDIVSIDLNTARIRPLDRASLAERDAAVRSGDTASPLLAYARQFAEADTIVIAAPYWDLSFPALLKDYIENVCVTGVTFTYTENGPVGLCKGKRLFFVTTCGGPFVPDFGYGYLSALARSMFGIPETFCFHAEGLDIIGADVDGIMAEAFARIDAF